MKSFNNAEIEVGQKVVLLETPVRQNHSFLNGEVVKLGKKQVTIKTGEHVYSDVTYEVTFLRYPEQIIVLESNQGVGNE